MYIPGVSEIAKCIMPVGLSKIVGKLENGMVQAFYQVGNKVYLSVSKQNDGTLDKGYFTENDKCNLPVIGQSKPDLSTVHDNCKGPIYKVSNIIVDSNNNQHNVILEQNVISYQNNTANILGQNYDIVNGNMFSQEDVIKFLGLKDCNIETAKTKLQEYNDYLQSLIPTTTEATTTVESSISVLSRGLEALGISVENLTPTEIGKNILNALNIPFTDPTTTAEDTNDDGYTGAYIAAGIVGGMAIGTALGYGIKYGIDWYKGKNNTVKHDEENQLLDINSELYKIKDFIPSLINILKELSEHDEKYEDIEEDQSLNEEVNCKKLILGLYKFSKSLKHLKQCNDICNALKEIKAFSDQGNTQTPAYDRKMLNLQDLLGAFDPGSPNDSVSTIGEIIDDLS
ncbi:MAG: DUF5460 family protein [Rickettsia endosymbiont of Pentastiridius leporinus]